jgi:hypothetical protein
MRPFLLAFLLFSTAAFGNPTRIENEKPGSSAWKLDLRADSGEIEGYASMTSVDAGDSIALFLSGDGDSATIDVFRMGWYAGRGGRLLHTAQHPLQRQTPPQADPATGLIECRWTNPYALPVPEDWVSGVYLAKLTARPSGRQNYIIFIVRDDDRRADLLFQSSATTMQAYNNWGGKSLYGFNSTGNAADKVSFNRPYSTRTGAYEFLFGWEYQMARFLEREGYDVAYATNIDTHALEELLPRHEAFLSVGHDEYWSWEMRRHVESALTSRIDLGFFSSNTCYWQIRLEPGHDGAPHRTMVAYKEDALSKDPIVADGNPSNDHLATVKWRDVPIGRPEEALIGVMYTYNPVDGDIVVENTHHWVFKDTHLRDGDRLKGLLGYEVDRIFGHHPRGVTMLARSHFKHANGFDDVSHMTIYQAHSGAWVFATGSMQWSWGLDDFNSAGTGGVRVSAAAQQITRNVLAKMTGKGRRRVVVGR